MQNRSMVKFPLWIVLNIPFAIILLISAGLIAYLGIQNGTTVASNLTNQLLADSSLRVQQNLASYLTTPDQVNEQNLANIHLKQLATTDPLTLQRHFLA